MSEETDFQTKETDFQTRVSNIFDECKAILDEYTEIENDYKKKYLNEKTGIELANIEVNFPISKFIEEKFTEEQIQENIEKLRKAIDAKNELQDSLPSLKKLHKEIQETRKNSTNDELKPLEQKKNHILRMNDILSQYEKYDNMMRDYQRAIYHKESLKTYKKGGKRKTKRKRLNKKKRKSARRKR